MGVAKIVPMNDQFWKNHKKFIFKLFLFKFLDICLLRSWEATARNSLEKNVILKLSTKIFNKIQIIGTILAITVWIYAFEKGNAGEIVFFNDISWKVHIYEILSFFLTKIWEMILRNVDNYHIKCKDENFQFWVYRSNTAKKLILWKRFLPSLYFFLSNSSSTDKNGSAKNLT